MKKNECLSPNDSSQNLFLGTYLGTYNKTEPRSDKDLGRVRYCPVSHTNQGSLLPLPLSISKKLFFFLSFTPHERFKKVVTFN